MKSWTYLSLYFDIITPYLHFASTILQIILIFLVDSKLPFLCAGCFLLAGLLTLENSKEAKEELRELKKEV